MNLDHYQVRPQAWVFEPALSSPLLQAVQPASEMMEEIAGKGEAGGVTGEIRSFAVRETWLSRPALPHQATRRLLVISKMYGQAPSAWPVPTNSNSISITEFWPLHSIRSKPWKGDQQPPFHAKRPPPFQPPGLEAAGADAKGANACELCLLLRSPRNQIQISLGPLDTNHTTGDSQAVFYQSGVSDLVDSSFHPGLA